MTAAELVVLSVFPEFMNVHGDAGNAAVLAARSTWAGRAARVVELRLGDSAPTVAPDIVVIGSGFDADAGVMLNALQDLSPVLHDWHAESVPFLAAGTGWELLATEIDFGGGTVQGVGLFTGRSTAVSTPVNGPIVVDSAFGELVGYEYHLRDYLPGPGEAPLGRVVAGVGNSAATRLEGARIVNAYGTHIAGPVLARNPRFADHLLAIVTSRRVGESRDAAKVDARTSRVDGWTVAANARVRRDG